MLPPWLWLLLSCTSANTSSFCHHRVSDGLNWDKRVRRAVCHQPPACHKGTAPCQMGGHGSLSCHNTEQAAWWQERRALVRYCAQKGVEHSRISRAHHGAWNQPKERPINIFQLLFKPGFLNLDTLGTGAGLSLCCRMFSTTSGLVPWDATLPQLEQPKMSPDIVQCPLGTKINLGEEPMISRKASGKQVCACSPTT